MNNSNFITKAGTFIACVVLVLIVFYYFVI